MVRHRIDSVRYCYWASANVTVDNVEAQSQRYADNGNMTVVGLGTDATNRNDKACRTLTPTTPPTMEPGEIVMLRVLVNYAAAAEIFFGPVSVSMTQTNTPRRGTASPATDPKPGPDVASR